MQCRKGERTRRRKRPDVSYILNKRHLLNEAINDSREREQSQTTRSHNANSSLESRFKEWHSYTKNNNLRWDLIHSRYVRLACRRQKLAPVFAANGVVFFTSYLRHSQSSPNIEVQIGTRFLALVS